MWYCGSLDVVVFYTLPLAHYAASYAILALSRSSGYTEPLLQFTTVRWQIGEKMLEIKNFTKIYGKDKVAADHVNLTVESGDIFGFIGHNGAGKSTTIRAVVGVMDFEEGDISIDGHSVKTEALECKKVTAYIPDNPDLYEHLTGIQYLNFIADVFQISATEREASIKKYADLFEITDALGSLISSYSHGMKQKLAIISAIIRKPKLMVLDEPFVGLDPKASLLLKNIMHEMCENGCAIFFSTHVLEVAQKLCNKIAIIKQGKIIACGKMEELIGDKSLEEVFMEVVEHEN